MHAEDWIKLEGCRLRSVGACKLRKVLNRNKGECTWCGGVVPKPRRYWCSQQCVEAFTFRQPAKARSEVELRDQGVCALCGVDTKKIASFLYKLWWGFERNVRLDIWRDVYHFYETHLFSVGFHSGKGRLFHAPLWEADHIVPVVLGGGLCLPSGYRTLCIPCHSRETAELNAQLAREKRGRKQVAVAKADSPARKWLVKNKATFGTANGFPTTVQRNKLFGQISSGKYVGILTDQGVLLTGRAVMQNDVGWVLNCSGPNNQQAVATRDSTVYVAGGTL